MKKFILSIIILGLILAVAGYWYWQRNPYSKEVLKLEIFGPEEVSLFQEVEYTVKYKNNGNVRLEEPKLIFEFPAHTIVSSNDGEDGQENLSIRQEIGPEELGDIYPGEEIVCNYDLTEVKGFRRKCNCGEVKCNGFFGCGKSFK